MVDVLLQSGDALRAQLARHQGAGGDALDTTELLVSIRALVAGERAGAAAARRAPAPRARPPRRRRRAGARRPAERPRASSSCASARSTTPSTADNLVDLFKEIADLGTIEPLDAGQRSRRHAPLQGR